MGVGRSERRVGWEASIHFERRDVSNRGVGDGVVGETYALGEARPVSIVVGGEIAHGAIPVTPPTFNLPIRLSVVAASRSASGARGVRDSG